ncbi:MAG: transcriptional regulator [Microvirga sp.]|jgi:uncharacterized protein involved in copper resistance|nr:transcriptional regulator [Microvirga sp.]
MSQSPANVGAFKFYEEGRPFLSPRRVADFLDVQTSELAKMTGMSHDILMDPTNGREVHEALNPIVRILALAEEMTGDDRRTATWFTQQSIPAWAGKTASELVVQGRAETVRNYLESVRAGVYP